jgi:hypothetical protein
VGTECQGSETNTSAVFWLSSTTNVPLRVPNLTSMSTTTTTQSVATYTITGAEGASSAIITSAVVIAVVYTSIAYSGAAVEVASGVPIAWESPDLASMSPPSAVLVQLAEAQAGFSVTSSSVTSLPSNTTNASSTQQSHSNATTLGLDIGLGAGLPVIIFTVIGFFYLRRRGRGKKSKQDDPAFAKAELAGKDAEKQFGELGRDGEIGEMNGTSEPVEADRRSLAAELEGGWHGYEAPTRS